MVTGEKLRLLRILRGMKQQSIAEQMGISQQAYSKLENRKTITERSLKRVLDLLKCTQADLDELDRLQLAGNRNDIPPVG